MTEAINVETSLPIPNGWYAVAVSEELTAGTLDRVHYFGQELVVFRTEAGEASVFEAYDNLDEALGSFD